MLSIAGQIKDTSAVQFQDTNCLPKFIGITNYFGFLGQFTTFVILNFLTLQVACTAE